MKSYKHLWEIVISPENIKNAIKNASKGKRKRRYVSKVFKNQEGYVPYFQKLAETYKHRKRKPKTIYDGISRKKRDIIVPSFDEQVLHHMIVGALQPIITKGMYRHSNGSIPGRGAVSAKKYIEKWIRSDTKNCKYYLKMDIRHFFGSIDHDVLKSYVSKYVHDDKFLSLLYEVLDCTDVGLSLGFHTSHWLAMWLLQRLDYYIKQELMATHYVRYMDDMVIFGSNKRKLHGMREKIERYLSNRLKLDLKSNWQVCRFHYVKSKKDRANFLDFMGYRFYRNRTTLRKSIMLKMVRKARKMAKKEKPNVFDCKQMLSYLGWLKQTDTYDMYCVWIKPYISFGKCKKRISRYDRKNNRKERETEVCGENLQIQAV